MNGCAGDFEPERSPQALPAGGSLLVVDDNPDDREHLARLVRTAQPEAAVRHAASGAEAIAALGAQPATCVLLDYGLPGEDGLAVLRRLAELDPFLPVIMITGQGNEALAVAALQAGASDYVVKGDITARGLARCIGFAVERTGLHRRVAEKSRDMEHFIRSLIHDARAPLRHITRFAEFLADDAQARDFGSVGEYTRAIIRSARRMDDLLVALRSYVLTSASGEVPLATVEMDEVVRAVTETLAEEIAGCGAEIRVRPLPAVRGHEPQLVQMFQNLLLNALKYSGGRRPEVWVSVAGSTPGGRVRIEVADNGTGIPPDQVERIFEPFTRLVSKDVIEGTGLGLAICRRAAEKMGGSIHCRSELGTGSWFVVELQPAIGPDAGA